MVSRYIFAVIGCTTYRYQMIGYSYQRKMGCKWKSHKGKAQALCEPRATWQQFSNRTSALWVEDSTVKSYTADVANFSKILLKTPMGAVQKCKHYTNKFSLLAWSCLWREYQLQAKNPQHKASLQRYKETGDIQTNKFKQSVFQSCGWQWARTEYNNVQRRVLEKSFGSTWIGTNVSNVAIPILFLYDVKNVSYVLYKCIIYL